MIKQGLQLPSLDNNRPSSRGSQSVKNLNYGSRIDESMRSDKQLMTMKSPFQLPSDDEVFLYCQIEKEKKDEGKRGMLDQHIWEKKTATSKNSLKHYKSFQGQLNEKHQTKTQYRQDEKKLIQVALDVCKKRKSKTDTSNQQKRESVVNLLEQKKEMFLVTMSHGIIESEIQRLQNISKDREQALLQSKKLLKQDEQNFTEYLEKNKQERLQAELSAENQGKERKDKETLLKELNIRLTSLRAEKSRNEESVVNYTENKFFFDKLAPKEWQEEKEKLKQVLIEQNEEQWIQESIEKMNEEEEQKVLKKKPKYDKVSVAQQNQIRRQKREEYFEKAKNMELEFLIEFDDNYPLHFKEPKQLVEHFDMMERKNLSQLSENQEIEEQYDQTLSAFQKIETEMNRRTNNLQEQKDTFKKQLDELDNQIKQMKKKSEENKNMINKEGQEITRKIEKLYRLFQNDLPLITDFKNSNIITILSKIELYMEKQLKNLKKYNPKTVGEQKISAEKNRMLLLRQQTTEQQKALNDEKNDKNRAKLMSITKKREGRKPMEKSKPLVKEVKVEEQEVNDKDEEDKKYFLEAYDLMKDLQ